jgi:hypothetical protein
MKFLKIQSNVQNNRVDFGIGVPLDYRISPREDNVRAKEVPDKKHLGFAQRPFLKGKTENFRVPSREEAYERSVNERPEGHRGQRNVEHRGRSALWHTEKAIQQPKAAHDSGARF